MFIPMSAIYVAVVALIFIVVMLVFEIKKQCKNMSDSYQQKVKEETAYYKEQIERMYRIHNRQKVYTYYDAGSTVIQDCINWKMCAQELYLTIVTKTGEVYTPIHKDGYKFVENKQSTIVTDPIEENHY